MTNELSTYDYKVAAREVKNYDDRKRRIAATSSAKNR